MTMSPKQRTAFLDKRNLLMPPVLQEEEPIHEKEPRTESIHPTVEVDASNSQPTSPDPPSSEKDKAPTTERSEADDEETENELDPSQFHLDNGIATGSNSQSSIAETVNSGESASQNHRQKSDIAWNYCSEVVNMQGRRTLTYGYCFKVIAGGGIHRMKQHLAGEQGSIVPCLRIDPAIRHAILASMKEKEQKSKEKKGNFGVENPFGRTTHTFDGDEIQEILFPSANEIGVSSKGKRKVTVSIGIRPFLKGGRDTSQLTIKACLQSKEKWENTGMAIALWFYDAYIPINAVNSLFFQKSIDQIASMGHGYKGPSYHSLRVNLLRNAKRDVKLVVDSFRSTWAETGCTLMGDGWKDTRQRLLINFLVCCSKDISFIKSVDAYDIVTNAENLCNLFAEIVEMLGLKNVVHLVTDNASNYKAAGSLLSERYPNICWSPCAAHCINLILKDIGEMNDVKGVVSLASTVTIFIYNHKFTLNWLRKTTGWKEIIRSGET
ncbi:uncharacterized protein [Coffea arabica]|uniref:DUF659 domain-containing protein n=1 Tax=Coffea arabica TaxID=13443 RepID=A0A6P6THG3_COFAR